MRDLPVPVLLTVLSLQVPVLVPAFLLNLVLMFLILVLPLWPLDPRVYHYQVLWKVTPLKTQWRLWEKRRKQLVMMSYHSF